MHPIPCTHCGQNFMRRSLHPDAPKLCHNCAQREQLRNPLPKENPMSTIKVQIECPEKEYRKIEEQCLNEGSNFTDYFLKLHYAATELQHDREAHTTETIFESYTPAKRGRKKHEN